MLLALIQSTRDKVDRDVFVVYDDKEEPVEEEEEVLG
jgi:hypothetical protein